MSCLSVSAAEKSTDTEHSGGIVDKLSQSPIMLNHNHRENLHSMVVDPTYGGCILDYLNMPQVSLIHPCTGTSHDIMIIMYCFVRFSVWSMAG